MKMTSVGSGMLCDPSILT